MSDQADTYTAFRLANEAGVACPDAPDSPGARFLESVRDDVAERFRDGSWDEDAPSEIADDAVPVYTFERWQTFVDLGAWDEDASELGATADDMTAAAGIALYMIAARLAESLADDMREDESDEDE